MGKLERKQVNFRKAQGYACPDCGSMLEWIFRTDSRGKRRRHVHVVYSSTPMCPDAASVPIMKEISKFESEQVGTRYRNEFCFECPNCGHRLSKHQAKKHTFKESELPADYYIAEISKSKLKTIVDAKERGASWEAIAALARLPDGDNEFDDNDDNQTQESLWKE